MKLRFLLPIGIVIGLLIILAIGLTLNPREVPSPLIGKPAPSFTLPKLGQPDQLFTEQNLKGHISLVNVWASWCVACREEHTQIERLAREYGLRIIGLNYKDEAQDALRWLQQFGNPYTAIIADQPGNVGIDWGVYGVPETFIVDPQGIIRYKHIGPISTQDVTDKIMPQIYALQGVGK